MSALDALRVPGTLTWNGSDLGLIRDVQLRREGTTNPLRMEEYGGESGDAVPREVLMQLQMQGQRVPPQPPPEFEQIKTRLRLDYQVLDVNLKGAFNLMRHTVPAMRATGRGGSVINVASINGLRGKFGQTNYSAAKAGEIGFTKALAQEGARNGITVNVVAPGYIATDMVMAVPEDVRAKIVAEIMCQRAHIGPFCAFDHKVNKGLGLYT